MAKFIEVTTTKGQKELFNTEVIESIHVNENKTIIRFSKHSNAPGSTLTIANSYEEIKNLILQ